MAMFTDYSADSILKQFGYLTNNCGKIIGHMTFSAAEWAAAKARGTAPKQEIANGIKISRTYRTPSDGGINNKVYFSGYLPFKGNRTSFIRRGKSGGKVYSTEKGIPVDFIAILFEYGRSTSPFPKKPFFRKAFDPNALERVMLQAQKEASGGILDE